MIEKIISKLSEASKELVSEGAKEHSSEKLQMIETTGSMAKTNQLNEIYELMSKNSENVSNAEKSVKNPALDMEKGENTDKHNNELSKLDPLDTENILFKPSDKSKLTFKGGLGICEMKCLSTGCVGAMGALSNPKPISHSVGKAHKG